MKKFAETIGVEDNATYKRFKDSQRLILNVSCSKYFIVRFVAKHIFNFKLSFKPIDYNTEFNPKAPEAPEDWDIFWTDSSVQPDRI